MAADFLETRPDGVRLRLRVTPGARRDAIEGAAASPDGAAELRVAVGAPPENGAANEAVVALLARAWRLPKSSFEVVRGGAARRKTVAIAGDPAAILRAVQRWREGG